MPTEPTSLRRRQCPRRCSRGRFSGDTHWPVLGDR
jgi:hypothetical protein